MFGISSTSNTLSKYKEKNIWLITKYKNALAYLDRFRTFSEDHKKNQIVGYRTLQESGAAHIDVKKLFDTLTYNSPRVEQLCKDLIRVLEEENVELTKHLSTSTTDTFSNSSQIDQLMRSYTEKQHGLIVELETLVPMFVRTANDVFQVEKSEDKLIEDYIHYYDSLENLIKAGKNNGEVFNALRALTVYLEKKILGDMENQNRDSEKLFLHNLSDGGKKENKNSHKFTNNFLEGGRGSEVFTIVNEISEEMRDNSYQNLDLDLKKKIDKFLSDYLVKLFKGINTVENKLKEQKSQGKLSDLEPTYFNIVAQLIEKLNIKKVEGYKVPAISSLDNLVVYEKEDNGVMSFKDFTKEIIGGKTKEAEAIAKNTISYLQSVVSDETGPYKKFLDLQVKHSSQTNIRKSGGDDEDGEDWDEIKEFSGAEKINSKDVESKFTQMGQELVSISKAILTAIVEEDNWKENKYEHEDEFNANKAAVLLIIKTMGRNLKEFSNKKTWNENKLKVNLESLKSLVRKWNSISIDKNLVEEVCNDSIRIIQTILK